MGTTEMQEIPATRTCVDVAAKVDTFSPEAAEIGSRAGLIRSRYLSAYRAIHLTKRPYARMMVGRFQTGWLESIGAFPMGGPSHSRVRIGDPDRGTLTRRREISV